MTDSLTFLQSVAGFTRAQTDGSADRPWKIGTIDPAYVKSSFPGTMPKVTFDGESTLSGKTYVVMSGYRPAPSDRVVLAPVGTTYMIVGCLDTDASAYFGGTLDVAGNATVGGTLGVTGTVALSSTITSNSLQIPLGYPATAGYYTGGSAIASSTGTEVAIPQATWTVEPNFTFVNGRIYRLYAQFGWGINAASNTVHYVQVKIRKGSASNSGQLLGGVEICGTGSTTFLSNNFEAIVKNVSGSNISSALSLTMQRASGLTTVSLYGSSTAGMTQLQVRMQDLGLESSHALSAMAVSIT